jgi:hypothetical protein
LFIRSDPATADRSKNAKPEVKALLIDMISQNDKNRNSLELLAWKRNEKIVLWVFNMNKKFIIAVLAMLGSPCALPADGSYNLVGLGLSPLKSESSTLFGFGVSVGGGYNFNQYFGIETQIGVMGIGSANNVAVMPIPEITLNGYVPVGERISLFGKIGKSETIVGYSGSDTQAHYSGQANFYGVGFEFSLTASKDTYRLGVDYYDLGATPGASLSAYYINLSSTTHF